MKKRKILFIILLCVISCFSAFCFSYGKIKDINSITVEATDNRNILSKGTSIQILGVFLDSEFVSADKVFSKGWEVKDDGSIVWNSWSKNVSTNKVNLNIPRGKICELKILGNIFGGIVRIYDSDRNYYYDFYANSNNSDIRIALNLEFDFTSFISYFIMLIFIGGVLYKVLSYFSIINLEKSFTKRTDIIIEGISILCFIVASSIINLISNEKIMIVFSAYFLLFFYNSKFKLNIIEDKETLKIEFSAVRLYLTFGFLYYIYISRFSYIYNIFFYIDNFTIRYIFSIIVYISVGYAVYILMKYITLFILYLLRDLVTKLDRFEKNYIIIMSILVLIVGITLYSRTSAFSYGYKLDSNGNESRIWSDIIYGFDHSWIISAYTDITSQGKLYNIRHPFINIGQLILASISLPFSILFKPFSREIDALVISLLNSILMIWSAVLLKRITKNNWSAILYSVSYFFMIFCLGAEQYQISIFFIILSVYLYFNICANDMYKLFSYIMMSGTTIISGALIPIITYEKDKYKWFKKVILYIIYFISFVVILGNLSTLYVKEFLSLMIYKDKFSFIKNLYCFTNFVRDTLIYPAKAHIIQKTYSEIDLFNGYGINIDDYTSVSIIGVVILLISIISIFKNKKKKIVNICTYNIVISFILNVIIGWSQREHWLYVILFSWSYIILIIEFIEVILKKYKVQAYIALLLILVFVNFSELSKVFEFAVKYYIP